MHRPVLRTVIILLSVIILFLGTAGGFLWWKVSGLKAQIVTELESKLHAHIEVSSFALNFWNGEMDAGDTL